MNVAVLGKGPSLNNYMELSEVDHYVIVNNFDQEVLQNEKLRNDLSTKPTTHVANRNILSMQGMISNDMYGTLNIVQHVQPYVDIMKCPHGGCYCNYFVDGYFCANDDVKVPTKILDSIHKNFMFKSGELEGHPGNKYPCYYPCSGLAAIAYATIELKPKNLYLIGFEFHEGGYAVGDNVEVLTAPKNERLGQKFMLNKLIETHKETHFNLYTLSEFSYKHGNLTMNEMKRRNKPMIENKKLAVVIGGWHYPHTYYKQIKAQKIPDGWEVDYFVVSHRDPELPIVFDEKQPLLESRGDGLLQSFDNELYSRIITKKELSEMGFIYNVEESSIGDLYQLNQWVKRHYEGQYDKVLYTHDDNYMLSDQLFIDILEYKAQLFISEDVNKLKEIPSKTEWCHLAAGIQEDTMVPRMSFTFLDKELLDKVKDKLEYITTVDVDLVRPGETNTLYDVVDGGQISTSALVSWNAPCRSFVQWMRDNNYVDRSARLSPYYRVTKYFIEGERGFMWTYNGEKGILDSISKYYDIS